LTLLLSEGDVLSLLDMDEVVIAVDNAFRHQGVGEASNFMRTRSRGNGSVLSVMHASLPYLGRSGLKSYLASGSGAKFVVVLFDANSSVPLAVLGADNLGRFRTGAASGVATKHLFGSKTGDLAILGSGKQALTQALGVRSVMSIGRVRTWSPTRSHREEFAAKLRKKGFDATASESPLGAMEGADVAITITSSHEPFVTKGMLDSVSHLNLAGGNVSEHSEIDAGALGSFGTIVVDDLAQAKVEYGALIQAAKTGDFRWESTLELGTVAAGKAKPRGKTLFVSGGAALEDVATASLVYDKAMKSGKSYPSVELV